MKLLVLTVLMYAAVTTALLLASSGLGVIGSDIGGRLGSGVGLGLGTALDVVPSVIGIKPRPESVPIRPVQPVRPNGPRDPRYSRGGESGRDYEGRTSSSGGREYERQGSGGDYARGGSYDREKSVNERERGSSFDTGRGRQGSERGSAGGRTDSYARDRDHSRRYDEGFAPGARY